MVDAQTAHRIATVVQLVESQYKARGLFSTPANQPYHLLVKLAHAQPALGTQATMAHDIAWQTARPFGLDAERYGPVMIAGGVQGLYIAFMQQNGTSEPMPPYAAAPSVVIKPGLSRPGVDDRCTTDCTW